MGHTRLGRIPKTRKWSEIVALLGETGKLPTEDLATISRRVLDATKTGLKLAADDPGVRYAFFLLTQLALASRKDDWSSRLSTLGISLPADATVFDLTAEVQGAIDDHLLSHGPRTDIGEIAQQAIGEALAATAGGQTPSMFLGGAENLQDALRGFSTKAGFADLGQKFFGQLLSRYLNFFLSRATADAVGRGRIAQLGDLNSFNDALVRHCEQSAHIVRDFCGEWYSKTEFQEGIDLQNASRFVAVALEKLQAEMRQQGAEQ
jgi:hypothetical protein